jgi:AraC family transcriptional regulator of adaptative response / DNA-3-methyladenine glycosylase II
LPIAKTAGTGKPARLELKYQPPILWDVLLQFLGARAIAGVESITYGCYRRTVELRSGNKLLRGWIEIANEPHNQQLKVTFPSSLLPVKDLVEKRVRHLFDLDCQPQVVTRALKSLNKVAVKPFVPGTRVPGCFDPFEMSVRAVLGQQITVKAACTLAMRLATKYGDPVETPFEELKLIFPSAQKIANLPKPIEEQFGALGVVGARSRSIYALANKVADGSIDLSIDGNPHECMQILQSLPGFGPWTANYVAMRALSWRDAFPHTDLGIRKALPELSAKQILELSEQWRPWRSYAAIALWNSLS